MGTLLKTEHLKKYYGSKTIVRAVDDVSLEIKEGASLALIGESGSGKTTFGKVAANLEKATDGKIFFQGEEITNLKTSQMRKHRKNMQMIFQSSGGVFDPSYTIGENIQEILKNYEKLSKTEYDERIEEALMQTGLDPSLKNRYVKQLSGGQCQRANIARALILKPKLVICDEPVSSLDYSIRKQILNLLNDIQHKYSVTYLLITHDLSNVPYLCKEVAIMYMGTIVEYMEDTTDMKERAQHPYTKKLFDSIPASDPLKRTVGQKKLEMVGVGVYADQGCPYQNRCPQCKQICKEARPELKEVAKGHKVACHLM
ncbi:MAG: ABC transporter ATP-binding protein [Eubacteriales bacterium]|nr:ABC transporter ATP-binding protein [Eubacteriales bacterium]